MFPHEVMKENNMKKSTKSGPTQLEFLRLLPANSFSRCVFLMTLTEIKLSVALVLQHAVNLSPVAGGQQRPRPYFLHRTTTRLPHDPECSLKSKDILASKLRPLQVFGDQLKQLRFTEVNVSAID